MKSKLKILFVEDVPSDFELIKREIKKSGIEFVDQLAESREAFHESLLTFKPDIILSDYSLPQFNGMEALEIRKKEAPNTPFILVTGALNEETAVEVMKAGCDDYILKQNLTRLGPAIKSALEKWETIKSKKQAEESLKASKDYIENLTNSMWDIVVSVKMPEREIEWVNNSIRSIGYEPGECISENTAFLYVNKDDYLEYGKKLQKSIAEGHNVFYSEQLLKKKNGDTFPADVTVTFDKEDGVVFRLTSIIRDISERKQAEEALKKTEQRYRDFFEKDISGNYLSTPKGKLLDCNQAFADMLGYSSEEILSINTKKLYSYSNIRSDFISRLTKNKHLVNSEIDLVRKDGKVINCIENVVGIFNQMGELVQFQGYLMDITDRKQAEEKIRKLSQAVEQSPASILITDLKGNIEYVNPKFSEVTGYLPGEAIGKNPRILKSEETLPHEYKDLWDTITAGNTWSGEFHNKKKNGELYWESASISPIINHEGKTTHYLAVKEDITERKKAEEALRESEEKFREMSNLLPQMIYEADINGNLTYVNEKAFEIFQYSKENFNQGINILEILIPDDIERAKENIRDILMGKVINNVEYTAIKKDGNRVPILTYSNPIMKNNKPVGMRGVIVDITERKQAEEKLRMSEERLRIFMDTASDSFALFDSELNFIDINKAAEANLGLKKKKIVGKNIDAIYPNFKETEDYNKYMNVIKTGQPISDTDDDLATKLGSQSIKRTVFKVGEGLGIITTDTTENEKAEEVLLESEMKLKKAAKVDLIGDWEFNLTNSQFQCSESIFKMFEIDPNEFEGTFDAFHKVIHPDDRDRVNAAYNESLLNKTPYEITFRLLMPDDRIKWFVEFCRTDFDAKGEPFRSLGIVHDITERKHAKR